MDNTVGAAAQRRRRRRNQLFIGLFALLAIGGLASSFIGPALTQTEGSMDTAMETVFVGPPELEVVWESVTNQTWSVSLVQGQIRNISNTTVRFSGITYSVKDENGNVIWEETDERYVAGGAIQPFGSIHFVIYPLAGRDARIFELRLKDAEVVRR